MNGTETATRLLKNEGGARSFPFVEIKETYRTESGEYFVRTKYERHLAHLGSTEPIPAEHTDNLSAEEIAGIEAVYGPPAKGCRTVGEKCAHCHSPRLQQTGACKTCMDCGTGTGCN